jgi:hypothetical protein
MSEIRKEYKTKVKPMGILELLDRPIAYHRCFVTLTRSVKAAVMLSQAVYWQPRSKQEDGWWYKTAEEWQEETGLSRHEQEKARKDCEKYLKSDLRGVPATLYWHVDEEALREDLLGENSETSLPESGKLDLPKQSNINRNTENTTEITEDFSEIEKQANRKVDAMLDMANFPGAKREIRLNAILSYIGSKLGVMAESKKWQEFAKFVDNRQLNFGESLERFIEWMTTQKGYDIQYWPPAKMQDLWPQAFMKPEQKDMVVLL